MSLETIFSEEIVLYAIIPLLIAFARVIDVSLGTLRIIMISKGVKVLPSLIGFVEVFIWIVVISKVIQNLDNIFSYLGYAAGFAVGTYIGMVLEEKISIGKVRIRVVTKKNLKTMIEDMRPTRYVFVNTHTDSSYGKIKIINAFIDRKYLENVIRRIKVRDPNAFYTVEELKMVKELDAPPELSKKYFFKNLFHSRKSK